MSVVSLADLEVSDALITALGGPKPIGNRFPAWWRGSKDRNCSRRGRSWFDHVANRGGGPLHLVMESTGCAKAEALGWLEAEGFIEPSKYRNAAEWREDAVRRTWAQREAEKVPHWRRAMVYRLNCAKDTAYRRNDWPRIAIFAPILHQLENGTPAKIWAAYQRHTRLYPRRAAAMVAWGRDLEAFSDAVGQACAFLIGMAGVTA